MTHVAQQELPAHVCNYARAFRHVPDFLALQSKEVRGDSATDGPRSAPERAHESPAGGGGVADSPFPLLPL